MTISDQNKAFYPLLAQLHTACLRQNIPFVSYRLPLQNTINTLVQTKSNPYQIKDYAELNTLEGFVIAPFSETDNDKTYFFTPEIQLTDNNIPEYLLSDINTNNSFILQEKVSKIQEKTTTKDEFESNVNKAILAIRNGDFRKVVLSKTHSIEISTEFSAAHFYQKLCSQYPHAFVYILQIPQVGCWIGASPEPLISTENEMLRTVSLAGTQPATNLPIEAYTWSDKELDEQSVVTGFIEKTLLNAGIENYNKKPVENYRAANLIHLKSTFEFKFSELKNGLSTLIQALHPTPSVGGLPKKESFDFITNNETHQRSYYTGFLGTINPNGNSQLFVNLRCMKLTSKQIILYSGAGITAGSVPENEWTETENKLMTLKQVIFSV